MPRQSWLAEHSPFPAEESQALPMEWIAKSRDGGVGVGFLVGFLFFPKQSF